MALPHELPVYPGHTDETTIGREWEHNPFVTVWRGAAPEGTEPCRVNGEDATLVVWSPDYDGKGKAWVRFAGRARRDRGRLARGAPVVVRLCGHEAGRRLPADRDRPRPGGRARRTPRASRSSASTT